MKVQVLIVDDEEMLCTTTAEYFNALGVNTAAVYSSKDCLSFLEENSVELILLDINLGDGSGFDLCRELRKQYDVPILFISARQSTDDMVIALNIGGDDYITKPYHLNVLLAKVNARLRRNESRIDHTVHGDLRIDHEKLKVFKEDQDCNLKSKEFKLLCYLAANKNRVISKDELFDNVWEDTFFSDGTLNVHIRHLREKLEDDPANPKYIKTIWGKGYMFEK